MRDFAGVLSCMELCSNRNAAFGTSVRLGPGTAPLLWRGCARAMRCRAVYGTRTNSGSKPPWPPTDSTPGINLSKKSKGRICNDE